MNAMKNLGVGMFGLLLLGACGTPDFEDPAGEDVLEEEGDLGEAQQAVLFDPYAGWYRIHVAGGTCVQAGGGVGSDLVDRDCDYDHNQQVKFMPAGNGWFRIQFRHNGYFLTVPQNTSSQLERLWTYPETGWYDQLFRLEDTGDGHIRIFTYHNLALTFVEMIDVDYWVYQETDHYLTQFVIGSWHDNTATDYHSYFWVDLAQSTDIVAWISDWGYSDRRWMIDSNGDGKADYCRAAGNSAGSGSYLRCTFSTGTAFTNSNSDLWSPLGDWGHSDRRWMIDVNDDNYTDYCRASVEHDGLLRCTYSNGFGFYPPNLDSYYPIADWGYSDRRWMIDFNGDGRADYCRAAGTWEGSGSYLRCTFSNVGGFPDNSSDTWVPMDDWGYSDRRWMVDFNGDGKTDYCRAVGGPGASSHLRCSVSNGSGFSSPGADPWIPMDDWGYSDRRWMIDVNGDAKADFCRAVGAPYGDGSYLRCSLSNGAGFVAGADIMRPMPDWGSANKRFMADVDGNGRADFGYGNALFTPLFAFKPF
jgi:hypothetical protein